MNVVETRNSLSSYRSVHLLRKFVTSLVALSNSEVSDIVSDVEFFLCAANFRIEVPESW